MPSVADLAASRIQLSGQVPSFADLAASRIQLSGQVLAQAVQDETVLLDLASAQYFGLDPVGSRVWALLAEGRDLAQVRDQLLNEFDVTAAVLEPDLVTLLEALAAAGLVALAAPAQDA